MTSTSFHETVASELQKKGLPEDYRNRVIAELKDHEEAIVSEELQESGTSRSEAHKRARQRLGSPDQFTNSLIDRLRESRLFGRYPLLTFLVLPLLTFLGMNYLFATASQSLMLWLECYLQNCEAFLANNTYLLAYWILYGSLKYGLPIALSFLFIHLSRRFYWGYRGILYVMTALTIFTLGTQVGGIAPSVDLSQSAQLIFNVRMGVFEILHAVFEVCTSLRLGVPFAVFFGTYLVENYRNSTSKTPALK